MDGQLDFRPTAPWHNLRLRAELLQQLRAFFVDRGFLEVCTPLLSADTVIDRHLDPLSMTLFPDPARPDIGQKYYLQTSPEFHMKRLLAAGAEAIYQITHAFRAAESGSRHNPEFMIVEWYRVGDAMNEGIDLLAELCRALFDVTTVERITYEDAFLKWVGVSPHTASRTQLERVAANLDIGVQDDSSKFDRDTWLTLILTEIVEPNLGVNHPTVLYNYPASMAALSRIHSDNPPLAQRFELYVGGMELANGYHELCDCDELRRRNTECNQLRIRDGKPELPEDSRLLAAMESGLPSCTGVALGFDRLVMLKAGAKHIRDVIPFPIEQA